LNLKGTFESGAKLTVYKIDSTTLEPIFEDEERTTPLNNPIFADGFGVFPPVYYNAEQPIRLLLQESNGTTLFDLNPYIDSVFEAEDVLSEAASQVTEAAAEAQAARNAAANAAAAEGIVQGLVGPSYASTGAGLAATEDGEFFAVVVDDVVSIYLNDDGIADFQRSILSATTTQEALDEKAELVHTHVISDVTNLQTSLDAKAPLASPSLTGTPTTGGIEIGYRSIPRRTTSGTAVVGDRAGCVAVSAGFTIPSATFSAGDAVSIYNDSASAVAITQGSGLTLRLAATTTTGNRTLAARGLATVWFNTADEAIISGPGLT
jgi:hypothetical protein